MPLHLHLASGSDKAELVEGIAGRRSAARLRGEVSADKLERTAQRCVEACAHLIPALGLPSPSIRVISRNAINFGTGLADTDWFDRALIGQTNFGSACTFIVVHSKIQDSIADVLSPSTQQLIIACGIAGEIAYLVATRAGVGVTGIGGINPGLWAELCGTSDDVLYLIALGNAENGEKFDATSVDGHG
jgi:hypothetical protein